MRNGLFAKLALVNIKKNHQTYVPYILASLFDVAMLYMMLFINNNAGMKRIRHSGDVLMITSMGVGIIIIFSFIFLLYSNSFLMKRRQKELGLYNILGLEKRHISIVMSMETVITSLISLAGGILVGILGSKLVLLLLLKLIRLPAAFGFEIGIQAIITCLEVYGVIFAVILLVNIRKVYKAKPIELLKAENAGEREPKAKWLMALIGFICLFAGYYIAVTTESPLSALALFFVAVLLVMAGTYLLFTAGSIVILKIMRWNKKFYYKVKNFTAISGMLYRMKQNAVGLASICILSTGVLLMVSTTVCLNSGIDDIINLRCPSDVSVMYKADSKEQLENIRAKLLQEIEDQASYEKLNTEINFSSTLVKDGSGNWRFEKSDGSTFSELQNQLETLTVVPQEEYSRITGEEISLEPGEVLAYRDGKAGEDALEIHDSVYQVKEWLKDYEYVGDNFSSMDSIKLIVNDEDFQKLYEEQAEAYGGVSSMASMEMDVYLNGTEEEKEADASKIRDLAMEFFDGQKEAGNLPAESYCMTSVRYELYESFYSLFGGILFLGIFLGLLFLMGAAMIIYYKQVSEGYEDKDRFEIMQKVGMTHKEVKSSIHRQILMVFFLPLGMAALHIAMAFPMVKRLLALFSMTNIGLFAGCTVITILVFAVIYGIIYGLTARTYYKIVERR